MSWLGILNFSICQWFFFRLTRHMKKDILGWYKHPVTGETYATDYFSIQYFILPLTGWWSKYITIGKVKFKSIN